MNSANLSNHSLINNDVTDVISKYSRSVIQKSEMGQQSEAQVQ